MVNKIKNFRLKLFMGLPNGIRKLRKSRQPEFPNNGPGHQTREKQKNNALDECEGAIHSMRYKVYEILIDKD